VCVCTLEYKINSALGAHARLNVACESERMREER
jgi:hypothetical protein